MRLRLDANFCDLLSAFRACNVRYLIIGGWAVSVHAQPRATQDLDIFVGSERSNIDSLHEALLRFQTELQQTRFAMARLEQIEADAHVRVEEAPSPRGALPCRVRFSARCVAFSSRSVANCSSSETGSGAGTVAHWSGANGRGVSIMRRL